MRRSRARRSAAAALEQLHCSRQARTPDEPKNGSSWRRAASSRSGAATCGAATGPSTLTFTPCVSLRNRDSVFDDWPRRPAARTSSAIFRATVSTNTAWWAPSASPRSRARAALLVRGHPSPCSRPSGQLQPHQREARPRPAWRSRPSTTWRAGIRCRARNSSTRSSRARAPLIDRLFPQVRLVLFSGSFLRNTRDDLLDASRGGAVRTVGDPAHARHRLGGGLHEEYRCRASRHGAACRPRASAVALAHAYSARRGFPRSHTPRPPTADGRRDRRGPCPPTGAFAGGDTTVRGFLARSPGRLLRPDDPRITISQSPVPDRGQRRSDLQQRAAAPCSSTRCRA